MPELKVTRKRITPADRLSQLDEQIAKAVAVLDGLRDKRRSFVHATKAAATDLLKQIGEDA
jgi:hypothetical protein